MKHRKAGRLEHLAQEEQYENERAEMQSHQNEFQRNMGANVGYQGLAQPGGPLSPAAGVRPGGYEHETASTRYGGYENDRYETRSLDERPREGYGFIS